MFTFMIVFRKYQIFVPVVSFYFVTLIRHTLNTGTRIYRLTINRSMEQTDLWTAELRHFMPSLELNVILVHIYRESRSSTGEIVGQPL